MTQDSSRYQVVKTEDLQVGMFVHDVGRKWFKHPWLTNSKLLTSKKEIDRLREFGITDVVLDLSKGVGPRRVTPEGRPAEEGKPEKIEEVERRTGVREEEQIDRISADEELPQARETYLQALGWVRGLVDSFQSGQTINVDRAGSIVEDVLDSVFRNRDAFVALIKLKEYERYDVSHHLNSSILAVSFGRHLGFSREQLQILGLGALLQDIGKTQLPTWILNKPGPLTPEEFDIVRSHSYLGAKLLRKSPSLPSLALKTTLFHHERIDGSGYPKQLSGSQLNPYMIICGLVDVFDAVSANRIYKKGARPFQAMQVLFKMRDDKFPSNWVDRFIQCLGIYPVGTIIELNTGELGVVVGVNHAQLLRPKIKLVTDSQERPLARVRTVDLNNESYLEREIRSVRDPLTTTINPARYVDPYDSI
ncbi:MAG: HD-GYP domain-containing protein [Pseudomonadota bacterium]